MICCYMPLLQHKCYASNWSPGDPFARALASRATLYHAHPAWTPPTSHAHRDTAQQAQDSPVPTLYLAACGSKPPRRRVFHCDITIRDRGDVLRTRSCTAQMRKSMCCRLCEKLRFGMSQVGGFRPSRPPPPRPHRNDIVNMHSISKPSPVHTLCGLRRTRP
jgi:hypothetical protein